MHQKIALIIGFAFSTYAYVSVDKTYFDLCQQIFIFSLLALLLKNVSRQKDYSYVAIIGVLMLCDLYAMIKQVVKVGTIYVLTDYVMWFLVPFSIVLILIIDLVKYSKNNDTK